MGNAERGIDGFWRQVDMSSGADGCWLWTGAKNNHGYGRRFYRGKTRGAHRVSFELSGRTVPDNCELDHLCRTPACVNPLHLEPVTHRVNILRGKNCMAVNVAKTHCPKGHLYDESNTLTVHGQEIGRECRACKRERQRQRYLKHGAPTIKGVRSKFSDDTLLLALVLLVAGRTRKNTGQIVGMSKAYVTSYYKYWSRADGCT